MRPQSCSICSTKFFSKTTSRTAGLDLFLISAFWETNTPWPLVMSSRRYTCLKTNWPLSPLTPESHTHTPHRLVLPVFVIQGDKTLWNVFGGAGGGESTDEWWAPSLPRPLQVVCIKRQREGKHSRASCFQGSHLCEQIISPTRAVSYGCLDVMLHCAGVPVQCRFSACRVVWLTHYSLWCWKLINASRPGLAGVSLQHDFNVSLSLSWINLQSQSERQHQLVPIFALHLQMKHKDLTNMFQSSAGECEMSVCSSEIRGKIVMNQQVLFLCGKQ